MGVLLALLTAGFLWQNGNGIVEFLRLLDLEKPGQEDAIKPSHQKRVLDTQVTGKPKKIFTKKKPAVSLESPGHDAGTPASRSQPGANDSRDSEIDAPTKQILSHPFSIRLGSFSSIENAQKAILYYSQRGLSAYWAKVELSHGVWYRVFTGHFEDREQAERFKQEHGLTKAIVNETTFANLIASYSSLDEIKNQILLLRNHGYCPYVMEDDAKSGRLFVGAFLTKEGAERQYDGLKSSGIKAQIVKR
jgi:cell division septation protein DedD